MMDNMRDLLNLIGTDPDWSEYGDVRVTEKGDLLLFSYTNVAAYEGRWNWFERVSRGLIINRVTKEIVARPFDKFFNWFEGGRKASGHIVSVTEKVDGSMGILYRDDGYKIATRGSFDGPQAQWATEFYNKHWGNVVLPEAVTLIFEIIYPENRIVVDYGNREDMVLLAQRNRFTGEIASFWDTYQLGQALGWTLPEVYDFNRVEDILEATGKIDESKEGWVVEFSDGNRWKFKGDRYLELHKLINGISIKRVLEHIKAGTLDRFYKDVPEEFHDQIKQYEYDIQRTAFGIMSVVDVVYNSAPSGSRKEFAQWSKQFQDLTSYLFAKLDGKDVLQMIYERENFT